MLVLPLTLSTAQAHLYLNSGNFCPVSVSMKKASNFSGSSLSFNSFRIPIGLPAQKLPGTQMATRHLTSQGHLQRTQTFEALTGLRTLPEGQMTSLIALTSFTFTISTPIQRLHHGLVSAVNTILMPML